MKVLMFSSDPKLREEVSGVARRIQKYRDRLEKLDIILLDRSRGRFLRFFRGYFEARRILAEGRFDVISAQEPEHWFLAWLLSRKFKIPWQMQIHTDIMSPYFVKHSVFNFFRRMLAKFLIPRANCVRVVSERIKKSIKRPDAVVLPIFSARKDDGGINVKERYPGYDFYILMASRLTREKNIPLAIDAVREIKGALLIIVGAGPMKGVDGENVKWEGWQENLSGYYQSSDCFLLTSDYEGYGMAAAEALQYGLPVVMTDVGIAGEIVKNGENGLVVPVGNKEALVRALEKMRENPLKPAPLKLQTEEEYLRLYVESLKACAKSGKTK